MGEAVEHVRPEQFPQRLEHGQSPLCVAVVVLLPDEHPGEFVPQVRAQPRQRFVASEGELREHGQLGDIRQRHLELAQVPRDVPLHQVAVLRGVGVVPHRVPAPHLERALRQLGAGGRLAQLRGRVGLVDDRADALPVEDALPGEDRRAQDAVPTPRLMVAFGFPAGLEEALLVRPHIEVQHEHRPQQYREVFRPERVPVRQEGTDARFGKLGVVGRDVFQNLQRNEFLRLTD